jgi:predicted nucleic acid-binding protein
VKSVVLDTSIVSFAFKDSALFDLYRAGLSGSVRFISFQTVAEMRLGALLSRWGVPRTQKLEDFLASLQVVGYSDELCHRWAKVMHDARRAGRRLEAGDAWIAATALLLDVPLLTHVRDFADRAVTSVKVVCHAP